MLRPRWNKVLADLWGNKARTLLVVASIAVGVFAIGVISGTYVILSTDLRVSYGETNPANVSLITYPFTPELADAVAGMDGVADAEGRREVEVRVQTGPETWDTLELVAIPDFDTMQIHRLLPQRGAPVPADQEVVLERNTLTELGIAVGDTLTIELSDGTVRQLPVAGSVLDQNDIYDLILGEARGYVTFDTLAWLHQPMMLNQLYVTVAGGADDADHIGQIATQVIDRVERSGRPVFQTETALQDQHPLSSILRALLLVLVIIGILIVFLSGSLIANTMSALLNQHLRQIGVMKLIGARRVQVVGMYTALITSFGVIALVIAIPLGGWGAYALSAFAADIINFVLQPFRMVPVAVILQVSIALLVPPAAGLLPVLRGSRISVREAISSTGLGDEQEAQGWIDRWLARMRGISRPLLISLRNTFRRKGRLVLTLFTLTLGGAIFIAVFNTQAALDLTIEQTTRYFGADVSLDFARSYRTEKVIAEAMAVPGVEDVEVWRTTGAEIPSSDGTPATAVGIIAPPADSALIDPTLLEGRWLLPGDENAIAVNEAFWEIDPDLQVGDRLPLEIAGQEDEWIVVGVFRYTGMDDLVAYVNYDHLADLMGGTKRASNYRIVTREHDLAFQERVAGQIDDRFGALGLAVSQVDAGKALAVSIGDLLGILTAVLLVMALMTALVGSIGLTGTMSMNVMERTREIGVMRAIGAHNQIVFKLVVVEGGLIGLISFALGAVLSFPISALLSNVISQTIFGVPATLAFTAQGFLIWLGVVVALSVLSSLLPAYNATKLTIREVLAYE
jgi:putative ABC transport system permease protein